MKKYKDISTAFLFFSIIVIIAMGVHLYFDYQEYLNHPEWSAPFTVTILVRSVLYAPPIGLGFFLSYLFSRKAKESNSA